MSNDYQLQHLTEYSLYRWEWEVWGGLKAIKKNVRLKRVLFTSTVVRHTYIRRAREGSGIYIFENLGGVI